MGSELKWLPYTGDGNQYFLFVEPGSNPGGGTLQKTIDIPVLLSQKSHTDQWFRGAGCAVTAGIMAAAYRDNTIYNIHSFDGTAPSKQPYWTESDGYVRWETPCGWCFVEDGNVTKYPSDAETVAYIKSIIDMDIPPSAIARPLMVTGCWRTVTPVALRLTILRSLIQQMVRARR